MPGTKYVFNHLDSKLKIELLVRGGADPIHDGSVTRATVKPNSVETITYGDTENIYLNGIVIDATVDGQDLVKKSLVLKRGSPADDDMNINNTIEVSYSEGDLAVSYANTYPTQKGSFPANS